MVYIINNYDGSQLVGINDQTVNSTATSLRLPGRDYKPYGEVVVENLVWMLQNFSGETPPLRAIQGQIWYDKNSQDIKVYDGMEWVNTGKSLNGDQYPANAQTGQIFYHTTKKQLYVRDITPSWKLVGPMGATDNSDPLPSAPISHTDQQVLTVIDTSDAEHKVVQLIVEGVTVGVWSKDIEFTLASALAGFGPLVIKPGLNLNDLHVLNGLATNATNAVNATNATNATNAVTASPGDASTQIANTQFVTTALALKANLNGNAAQTFQVANATLATQAVNLAQAQALQPPGLMQEYAGAVAPAGWLLCDGAAVSRTTYQALYDVIGIIYGAGDGVNTFNLPDRRGRFGLGANGSYPLGSSGGSFTSGDTTLDLTQIPSHTHTADNASLTGTFGPFRQPLNSPDATGSGVFSRGTTFFSGDAFNGSRDAVEINMDATHSHTISAAGGGGAHNHSATPPYLAVNYIIRT